MTLLFAVISFVLIGGGLTENCDWNITVSDTFFCTGLTSNSGDYVKRVLLLEVQLLSKFDVYFDSSYLTDLPDDLFDGYYVESFYCEDCQMDKFPFKAMLSFGSYTNYIRFYFGTIGTVSGDLTAVLPFKSYITEFDFEYCDITRIAASAFTEFTGLTYLSLETGAIGSIDDYAVYRMPSLSYLGLSFSEINVLSRNTISALPSLTDYDIGHNNLQTLETGTVNDLDFPRLQNFYLYGNPWVCNCSLQWLKDYINEHPGIIGTEPKWAEPVVANFNEVDFCNFGGSTTVQ